MHNEMMAHKVCILAKHLAVCRWQRTHGAAVLFHFPAHDLVLGGGVTQGKQQRPGIAKKDKNNGSIKTTNKPTKPHPNSQRTTLQTCAPNIRLTTLGGGGGVLTHQLYQYKHN